MTTRETAPTYNDVVVKSSLGESTVHYVEAGDPSKPTLLLLMGFPSSSNQYRDFIPLMSDSYHILAPDMPGFGLTKVSTDFSYTFDNLAIVVSAWLKQLKVTSYAVYIFDYGAPVGFRLALENSSAIKAIISQNGNVADEGFGQDFWAVVFKLWETQNSQEVRETVRDNVLTQATTDFQYYEGVPEQDRKLIDPQQPIHDYIQNVAGKENQEHQLDLFYDYRNNKAAYPQWQEYLTKSQVPVLACWGKGDPAFRPPGAEAYARFNKNAEVHLLDGGHFLLETQRWEVARLSKKFLSKVEF